MFYFGRSHTTLQKEMRPPMKFMAHESNRGAAKIPDPGLAGAGTHTCMHTTGVMGFF